MRSMFVGEYYPLPNTEVSRRWYSIVWCLDNHQYGFKHQKHNLRGDLLDLKEHFDMAKSKGKPNERSTKPAKFTNWLNVALNAEDVDYLERQNPSGDDLLLELFTLVDAEYGFSAKLDFEARCVVVYLFSPPDPSTGENCALSARAISGTDALSALFYKFEHKLGGTMVPPEKRERSRFE